MDNLRVHAFIAAYREWDKKPTDPYSAMICTNMCSAIADDLDVNGPAFRALIQQRRREGFDIQTIVMGLVDSFS